MNSNYSMFAKPQTFGNHLQQQQQPQPAPPPTQQQQQQQAQQAQPAFYSNSNYRAAPAMTQAGDHQQQQQQQQSAQTFRQPNDHYWQQHYSNNNNDNNPNNNVPNNGNQTNNSQNGNNNYLNRISCSYKYDRRKISVHENFYNYSYPYEQRSRQEIHRKLSMPAEAYAPATFQGQPQQLQPPPQQLPQIPSLPSRKTSLVDPMLTPPMSSAGHMMKMDPPSSPMEVDVVRKTSLIHERPNPNSSLCISNPATSTSAAAAPTSSTSPPKTSYQPRSHPNITTRKASLMASKSQLRAPRFGETTQYTPPPILSPMRNGSGLFWQIAKSLAQNNQTTSTSACSGGSDSDTAGLYNGNDDVEMSESPGLKVDDSASSTTVSPSDSVVLPTCHEAQPSANQMHPTRKNGFFYMATQINQANFADELEALRKESIASTSSHRSEDFYGKSSASCSRKESTISIGFEVEEEVEDNCPRFTDANAHINIGSNYQAKVYKWREREISRAELEQLPDRDQLMFAPSVLEGLDPEQIQGFEMLACSQAIPCPGRNKELALHLLMENRGNIEAATADLLRCDTLDWQQYPIILSSSYSDSTYWTPEEIACFQDAIYKTEKDFPLVSQEVSNKSVLECVEFYYTWKKCCPDDYRKLRNLRRKRQLLEINLNQVEEAIPMKKCSLDEKPESMESGYHPESSAPPYQALQEYIDSSRPPSFQSFLSNSPLQDPSVVASTSNHHSSPNMVNPSKENSILNRNYQMNGTHRMHGGQNMPAKKGAQPSADGFFHCRLCDKCFEKVKSLNAHMKSHAMKARAEAEAKAQQDAQLVQQQQQQQQQQTLTSPANTALFQNSLNIVLPNTLQGLTHMSPSPNGTLGISQFQSVLNQQALGSIVHPRPQHPLLPTHLNTVLP